MIKVNAEQEIFSVDAEQQLRGVLSKLKDYCDSLKPSNDQETFRIIIEKDRDSVLGSGNEEQREDIPNHHMGTGYHLGERATNMVKIRSVQAGRLVFALWREPAQTPSQPPTYTSAKHKVVVDATTTEQEMIVGVSECLKHWQLTSVMDEEFTIRRPETEEIATIGARLLHIVLKLRLEKPHA